MRVFVSCLLLAATIQAAETGPVVQTTYGPIAGVVKEGITSFLGIPYAAPPTGTRRWREPGPPEPWTAVRAARELGPPCPQVGKEAGRKPDEDCLTINVWSPAREGGKLPVMVYLHGGASLHGSASRPLYDGTNFAKEGVVFVSMNFRLGIMGFFAHPSLSAESRTGTSGNYILMDQLFALMWVRDNIAAFGGDPANVTLFGQSSGATQVCALMASRLSRGLFHRAIAQSGNPQLPMRFRARTAFGLASMETVGEGIARRAGVRKGEDALARLRASSWEKLVAVAEGEGGIAEGGVGPMIVDGFVLTEPPLVTFARGTQLPVPFVTGTTRDEGTILSDPSGIDTIEEFREILRRVFRERAAEAQALYPGGSEVSARKSAVAIVSDGFVCGARRAARAHSAIQPRTYLYQFTYEPEWARREGLGSFHSLELSFVFQTPRRPFEGGEARLSKAMAAYWTNFARGGDPHGEGLPPWPRYEPDSDLHLSLGLELRQSSALRRAQCDLNDFLYLVPSEQTEKVGQD